MRTLDQIRGVPRRTVRLEDGSTGYLMDPARASDDCLRPAIATVLQVPVRQVPDLRLMQRFTALLASKVPHDADPEGSLLDAIGREAWNDAAQQVSTRAWAQLAEWADRRGLHLTFHDDAPIDRERWIGVLSPPEGATSVGGLSVDELPFADHCAVFAYGECIHDPASGLAAPSGMRLRRPRVEDIAYSITIDRKED